MPRITKNNNIEIEVKDGNINLVENLEKKVLTKINTNDPAVEGLYTATKNFIQILINNNGNVGINNSELSFLIKECLEFGHSYKKSVGERKKQLIVSILKNIIEIEINKEYLNDLLKEQILHSVDNIIDPAIELAIYVARGNVKINKKKIKQGFEKICPCLKFN